MRRYSDRLLRDPSYWKPPKFKNYRTLKELAVYIGRDPSWIRAKEKAGEIVSPARVKRGQLYIRLYSPVQAEEIKRYFQR